MRFGIGVKTDLVSGVSIHYTIRESAAENTLGLLLLICPYCFTQPHALGMLSPSLPNGIDSMLFLKPQVPHH